ITASFVRAIERFAGDLCLHFLPLFQKVVAIKKTCNQLIMYPKKSVVGWRYPQTTFLSVGAAGAALQLCPSPPWSTSHPSDTWWSPVRPPDGPRSMSWYGSTPGLPQWSRGAPRSSGFRGCPSSARSDCTYYGTEDSRPTAHVGDTGAQTRPGAA